MGEIKWYKRDPDAALAGMAELSLEERGAYNTVLDLIYSKADKLRDDDRHLAAACGCDLRVWKRIKTKLIEKGKLTVEDGLLRNFRATSVVLEALGRVTSAAEAGRASAAARAAKSQAQNNKNNSLAETVVQRPSERPFQLARTTATTTPRSLAKPLDWSDLERNLRQAAGWQSETHPNLAVVGQIAALIESGADLDRDVLPIVKAKALEVRKRTSWNYFVPAIEEARDRRLALKASAPKADKPQWETWTEDRYENAVMVAKRKGIWPETYGPADRIPKRLVDAELTAIIARSP